MRATEQVQVQLRLPHTSEPREQRCSSTTAHESLRRFAEGYVFGSASKIGPSLPQHRQQPIPSTSNTTAFGCNNRTDFASRAFKTDDDSCIMPTRRKRAEGKRGTLVFGENAPKVTLPVKERIERKTVPKRCRDTVSIDALSAMMESLLSHQTAPKRAKSSGHDENLTRTIGDMKLRRKPGERAVGKAKNLRSGKSPKPDIFVVKDDDKRAPQRRVAQLEDDEAADELSFLVNRCDLDSEKKQATFMPYIT